MRARAGARPRRGRRRRARRRAPRGRWRSSARRSRGRPRGRRRRRARGRATSPPWAPTPGSRNGVRGISSRMRARCSGTVAPVTAPTSASGVALAELVGQRAPGAPTAARRSRARRSSTSAAPGLEVRTSMNTPAPAARAIVDQRLERVAAEQRVGGEARRRASPGDGAERRRRAADQRLGVGGGGDGDVAALAVGEHEQAGGAGVRRSVASSASQPAEPRRSKQASCGLTATQAGPAASISARQWASTAAAASARRRGAGPPGAPRRGGSASTSADARRSRCSPDGLAAGPARGWAGSGSIPRTICDSRAATAAASRSPKRRASPGRAPNVAGARPAPASVLLDGLLEARAGGEARDAAGGDRHRLARTRVATLAGAALGDVELAEAGEVDVLTAPQRRPRSS